MESNGGKTKMGTSGTSLAFQRAKERENRTPDVKVMGKTVKLGTLKLGGVVVPLGRAVVPLVVLSGSTASRGGSTARVGILRRSNRGAILGWKWMILVAKFDEFRGWKVGKLGEMLDPLETKQIHGSKSTKHHQTNKSQKKKLGLFLVGIFEIGEEHNKIRLENTTGRLQIRDKPKL